MAARRRDRLIPYPEILDTARLTLKRPRRDDEAAVLAVWADPDVWRALRPDMPYDPHHGRTRFEHHLEHWESHGFGIWLIDDRATADTAGLVGASHPDFVPELTEEIEIGWSLRRPFWGRGMASEGAQAAVSAALENLRPRRLISLIDEENVRSASVAKRLGMRDVGWVEHAELDLPLRVYALEAPA